ncbi:MAG: hypothetical protein ACJAY5_001035 [Actinomycetes bacterium]|jgi:hypothetical protein
MSDSEAQNSPEESASDAPPLPSGIPLPGPLSSLGEELRTDVPIQSNTLVNAIGGWRGVIDSSLPSLTFITAYLVTGQNLTTAIWTAIGAGALVAIWRLLRRQSLQQIIGGFGGVALAAFIAARTGEAANFFLPGLLINLAYGIAFVISNLVRWPLVGVAVGAATGDATGWRQDPALTRAYRLVTWVWAGMFGLRLAIQLPLYFASLVGALGVAKIALGWPLILLVGLWSYRIIKPALAAAHARRQEASDNQGAQGVIDSESD